MKNIDLKFLLTAVLCLCAGVSLGLFMGIKHDFMLAPVHAHLNLLGWVSLALFGIVYRLYPALAERRLAAVHFYLAVPSALMFPVGIALSILAGRPLVAIVAGFMWLAGILVFLVQLVRLALGRSRPAPDLVPAE
jgi:cbb3-type cytochrome oxidase subunit 1